MKMTVRFTLLILFTLYSSFSFGQALTAAENIQTNLESITHETKLKIPLEQKDKAKELLTQAAIKEVVNAALKKNNFSEEQFWQKLGPQDLETFIVVSHMSPITRASNEPDLYFSTLTFSFDQEKFLKLQNTLVKVQNTGTDSIALRIDYELVNLGWNELGVTYKEDFTRVVEGSWIKWLKDLDPRLKNIEVVTAETPGMEVYLKLRLEKRANENSLTNGLNLHYSGGIYVKNNSNKEILFAGKLDESDQFYSETLKKNFSSAIANYAYRFPLGSFSKIKTLNLNSPTVHLTEELTLTKFSTSEQVFHLLDLLRDKGTALHLFPRLKSMGQGKAVIEMKYQGSEDNLKHLLTTQDFPGYKAHEDYEFTALPLNTPVLVPNKPSKEENSL